jgi:serine/threonine-protein kinase
MAPEQIRRGTVSHRTDIYGSSVILWELLTGERLFDGETQGIILGRVLDDPVPAPSQFRTDLSPEVDVVTLTGLNRDPERRYGSARAMAEYLEAIVPPATPVQVGEWVQTLARDALAERRDKLARMERDTA